jgi:hypothetical protein
MRSIKKESNLCTLAHLYYTFNKVYTLRYIQLPTDPTFQPRKITDKGWSGCSMQFPRFLITRTLRKKQIWIFVITSSYYCLYWYLSWRKFYENIQQVSLGVLCVLLVDTGEVWTFSHFHRIIFHKRKYCDFCSTAHITPKYTLYSSKHLQFLHLIEIFLFEYVVLLHVLSPYFHANVDLCFDHLAVISSVVSFFVTDLINELPGYSSVNTVQHATIDEAVFSLSSTPSSGGTTGLCNHF